MLSINSTSNSGAAARKKLGGSFVNLLNDMVDYPNKTILYFDLAIVLIL